MSNDSFRAESDCGVCSLLGCHTEIFIIVYVYKAIPYSVIRNH